MDNVEKTKKYFDRNIDRLKLKKKTKQLAIVETTALSLEGKLKGKVLNIGSGGYINFSLDHIDKLISLDISIKSLEKIDRGNKIQFILGDARNLSLGNDSVDRVVMFYVVHHLAGNNLFDTYKNIESCFKESYRVLDNSGRILIADAICPGVMQRMENVFFNISNSILNLFSKPMVYFFSLQDLIGMLYRAGFKKINFSYLNTGGAKFSPFTSSISIPFKYIPISHVLIEGIK